MMLLDRVKLSRFASNFIFSCSPRLTLNVQNSQFEYFLRSPLAYTAKDYIGADIFNHTHVYSGHNHVNVLNSRFRNCASQDSHGGAIFFDASTFSASILQCCFVDCTSMKQGGALYGFFSSVSLHRCCFSSCFSPQYGHSFVILCKEKIQPGNISQIFILNCSSSERVVGKAAAVVMAGSYKIRLTNFTLDHSYSYATALGSITCGSLWVEMSQITNSTGQTLLNNYAIYTYVKYSLVQLIGNRCKSAIIAVSDFTTFSYCSFLENDCPSFIKNVFKGLSFRGCAIEENATMAFINGIAKTKSVNIISIPAMSGCEFDSNDVDGRADEIMVAISDSPSYIRDAFGGKMEIQYPTPKQTPTTISKEVYHTKTAVATAAPTKTKPILLIVEESSATQMESEEQESIPTATRQLAKRRRKPKVTQPKVSIEPSHTFSPTAKLFGTKTFSPSMHFTASTHSGIPAVPIVLYSAAAMVLIAITITAFCLGGNSFGYSIITQTSTSEHVSSHGTSPSLAYSESATT